MSMIGAKVRAPCLLIKINNNNLAVLNLLLPYFGHSN